LSTPLVVAAGLENTYEANLKENLCVEVGLSPIIFGITYQSCSTPEVPLPAPNITALRFGETEALLKNPVFVVVVLGGVLHQSPDQLKVSILSNAIVSIQV
jgi:hypothetical protein